MLHRPNGPAYEVILDEVVLRRRSVPPQVFRRQIERIVELADEKGQVTVRVLPVDAEISGYNIPECSFSIYAYPDSGDPVAVGLEAVATDLVLTGSGADRAVRDGVHRFGECGAFGGEVARDVDAGGRVPAVPLGRRS